MAEPVALLLAAGAGRRFGGNKLLHPLTDARCVALETLENVKRAIDRVVAVVSAEGDLSRVLTEHGCEVRVFKEASQGLGASIAFGVSITPNDGGWLVALADMPYIRSETYAAVASAMNDGAPLAAPFYKERRGHPVGFAVRFAAELCALQGDVGAKSILERHRRLLRPVVCDDAGVLKDIDSPKDLCA